MKGRVEGSITIPHCKSSNKKGLIFWYCYIDLLREGGYSQESEGNNACGAIQYREVRCYVTYMAASLHAWRLYNQHTHSNCRLIELTCYNYAHLYMYMPKLMSYVFINNQVSSFIVHIHHLHDLTATYDYDWLIAQC